MRGFYLDVRELPGPVVKTEKELIEALKAFANVDKNYAVKIRCFNEEYNKMNDGNASERLVRILTDNQRKESQ